jgi:hypothetical protein
MAPASPPYFSTTTASIVCIAALGAKLDGVLRPEWPDAKRRLLLRRERHAVG